MLNFIRYHLAWLRSNADYRESLALIYDQPRRAIVFRVMRRLTTRIMACIDTKRLSDHAK